MKIQKKGLNLAIIIVFGNKIFSFSGIFRGNLHFPGGHGIRGKNRRKLISSSPNGDDGCLGLGWARRGRWCIIKSFALFGIKNSFWGPSKIHFSTLFNAMKNANFLWGNRLKYLAKNRLKVFRVTLNFMKS